MKKKLILGLSIILSAVVMNGFSSVVSNYFQDGSFEALTGNEPNAGTSPWFTSGENADGSFLRVTNEAHTGSQSVKYAFNFDDGAVVQNLNAQWDTNLVYEVSFWMLSLKETTAAAHTNAATINVGLYTSTNSGATYDFVSTLYSGALNSDTNIWEKFTAIVAGSSLAAKQGQDIQIRFKKPNQNTRDRSYIDDAEFGVYAVDTPPASVLIGYYGSTGTNVDYSSAGISGTLFGDKIYQVNASAGSTDGTYGSTNGASLLPGAYEVRIGGDPVSNASNRVAFRINNNTGSPLQLDSISFDYARWFTNGPTNLTLLYSYGDLGNTNNTVINVYSGTSALGGNSGDYDDFDWSLSGLSDQVLSAGQYAVFRLEATGSIGAFSSGAFDNIAIIGGAFAGTGYDLWSLPYGLTGGQQDDDDDDGLINLYEYGLGGNPTNGFVNGNIPTFGNTGSGFEYVYAQRTDDPTLSYYLETDLDLVNPPGWTNAGYTVVATNVTGGTFDYVTNSVPTADDEKFIRLKIEQN